MSGVTLSRLLGCGRGRLSPLIEARGAGVTELRRASLVFLASLASSVLFSLLLTPAMMALPTEARFRDWRREELRVLGLLRGCLGLPLGWAGSGMFGYLDI